MSACDFSVIIPAYNEELWLPATLARLREAMASVGLQGEVIVVDNRSTDRTPEIAARSGCRVVFEPVNHISRARNRGAQAARGRYLLFLDADTLLPPALLSQALDHLASGRYCGGGALLAFDRRLPPLARTFTACWNLLSIHSALAAGSFLWCLRQGFEAVGGFSEKVYAGEEIWLSRALRRWGRERGLLFRIIPGPPVVTSSRKFSWYSSLQLALLVLLFTLFPFAARFRRLCSFWYRRPSG